MELSGNSIQNEVILNSRYMINEAFKDDPSYQNNRIYFWRLGLNSYEDEPAVNIRLYNRKYSDANGVTLQFQTPITDPVVVGDVLYDTKQGIHYICEASFNIDDIHFQGLLIRCNWMLKWQLSDGTIVEYPCQDMNSTQYNSGERSNKVYTVGSSQHILTLPCDENTLALSSPVRFYLDKDHTKTTTYRVTQNDTTSSNYDKGLCKVTVTECPENREVDNRELGVCDYFKAAVSEEGLLAHIDYDTNTIKSGGSMHTFTARFTDENGDSVDTAAKWSIVCDFKDELEVKELGNKIMIGIDNDNYIDEDFKLCLSDDTGTNTDSLIIHIDSLL